MNYKTLIDDFVLRLAPLLDDGIEVERLPETEGEYTKPFDNARVTVAYKSSEFYRQDVKGLPGSLSTNEYVGQEFAEVHVAVRSRLLYDDSTGVFAVTAAVKKLLYGFTPTHFGRVAPKTYGIGENENGVWMCVLVFVCESVAVQYLADDAAIEYPELEGITFNISTS